MLHQQEEENKNEDKDEGINRRIVSEHKEDEPKGTSTHWNVGT